jgi:16S rRNA processing protein RimM
MENFGAGDLLELRTPEGRTVLVPFTRQYVPVVDLPGGRVVIAPVPGLLDQEDAAAAGDGAGHPSGKDDGKESQ